MAVGDSLSLVAEDGVLVPYLWRCPCCRCRRNLPAMPEGISATARVALILVCPQLSRQHDMAPVELLHGRRATRTWCPGA